MQIINGFASYFISKKPRHFFGLLTFLSIFLIGHTASAVPPLYDGDMHNNCPPSGICNSQSLDNTFATPGVTLPTHGFVQATGSFISPIGEWTVVDFDHQTVASITTIFDSSTRTSTVQKKTSVKVSTEAIAVVKNLAASLWNAKTSLPPHDFCTDVAQEFILFDGDRAMWYRGGCPPDGISGEMNKWAETQLQGSTKH